MNNKILKNKVSRHFKNENFNSNISSINTISNINENENKSMIKSENIDNTKSGINEFDCINSTFIKLNIKENEDFLIENSKTSFKNGNKIKFKVYEIGINNNLVISDYYYGEILNFNIKTKGLLILLNINTNFYSKEDGIYTGTRKENMRDKHKKDENYINNQIVIEMEKFHNLLEIYNFNDNLVNENTTNCNDLYICKKDNGQNDNFIINVFIKDLIEFWYYSTDEDKISKLKSNDIPIQNLNNHGKISKNYLMSNCEDNYSELSDTMKMFIRQIDFYFSSPYYENCSYLKSQENHNRCKIKYNRYKFDDNSKFQ